MAQPDRTLINLLMPLHSRSEDGALGLGGRQSWLHAIILVALINVCFFGFALWGAAIQTEPLAERVRNAFAAGDLTQEDYLPYDSKRGVHQYNDCLILQMLVNHDEQIVPKAVGRLLYIKDASYTDYCTTLLEIVSTNGDTADYLVERYTRYWHGYMLLSAALLQVLDLSNIRRGIKGLLYGALILLVFAAGRQHRGTLAVAASIAATGVFFWGLPYFGQSLAHAPGDAFVILGIACLLFWRKRFSHLRTFIPFCAAYGAGVVYLEFLTGQLPTAAGLLFPLAYLIAVTRPEHENNLLKSWMFAIGGIAAFAVGGGITVILKQVLAVIFVGPQALQNFLGNLNLYTNVPASTDGNRLNAIFMSVVSLLREGVVLTYGSSGGAKVLFVSTALAWLAACWLAVRGKGARQISDLLAFAAGPLVLAGWIVLFSSHTGGHAWFITRILIVPISLGWGALAWQLLVASSLDRVALPQAADYPVRSRKRRE